jgi:hypothetical protein
MDCRRPLILASIVAATAFALLAAGCGGGGSSGVARVASTPTTTVNPSAGSSTQSTGLVPFASCMRSHGLPGFPDPSGDGGMSKRAVVSAFQSVGTSVAAAAQRACNHLLPAGGMSGQPVQTITPAERTDYLKGAACMRTHGFPGFPDPTFPGSGVRLDIPSSIDTSSPRFTSAATICTKLIPAGLPYTKPSGSRPGSTSP